MLFHKVSFLVMDRQYVSVSQAALPPTLSQVSSTVLTAPPGLSHCSDLLLYVLQMLCAFPQDPTM